MNHEIKALITKKIKIKKDLIRKIQNHHLKNLLRKSFPNFLILNQIERHLAIYMLTKEHKNMLMMEHKRRTIFIPR